jgi:catechol 2,3-dioxygenase-like lactoylglutathione lyase family enzyme
MAKKKSTRTSGASGVTFNHAMIYTADLGRALEFYQSALGFGLLQQEGPYYARLKSPTGSTTIALHKLEPGRTASSDGIRLYFEVKGLAAFCRKLAARGVTIREMPKKMPWGWTHAYLDDPDGHEVSLYWAGEARLKRAARK